MYPNGVTGYKFEEVCDYYLRAGFGCGNVLYFIGNLDVWNGLPADLQDVILEVFAEYQDLNVEHLAADEAASLKVMEKAGVQILEITEEERAKWMNSIGDPAAQPIEDMVKAGLPGKDFFAQ